MFLIIKRAETLPLMSGKMIADIFCSTFQVNPKDLAAEDSEKEVENRLKILLGTSYTLQY